MISSKAKTINLFLLFVFYSFFAFSQNDTEVGDRGTIIGRVICEGVCYPLVPVEVYRKEKLICAIRADSSGRFQINNLKPGWYRVTAIAENKEILDGNNVLVTDIEDEIAVCDEFIPKNKKIKLIPPKPFNTTLKNKVDSIFVSKSDRELNVFRKGKLLKTYRINLGFAPVGPKQFEGDGKTPEGLYRIDYKNANSRCRKGLRISYPNMNDIDFAQKAGKSPGGNIEIHSIPNGTSPNAYYLNNRDWSWGCIIVTDEEIDELFHYVSTGIPILISP